MSKRRKRTPKSDPLGDIVEANLEWIAKDLGLEETPPPATPSRFTVTIQEYVGFEAVDR